MNLSPVSVPHLAALASGQDCSGPHRCYYCAAPCGEDNPASVHVKDSFTGRDSVPCPGSSWVCNGCVYCMQDSATVPMYDGTPRLVTRGAMRAFSWVITRNSLRAASKANLDFLREICLEPPEPPFAIVLSDSGQKHLLYRGAVNWSRDPLTVTLETERISYTPEHLQDRLELVGQLVAATGKPALQEPPTFAFVRNVLERYHNGEALIHTWMEVFADPLSTLAVWLSPNKETCSARYPATA